MLWYANGANGGWWPKIFGFVLNCPFKCAFCKVCSSCSVFVVFDLLNKRQHSLCDFFLTQPQEFSLCSVERVYVVYFYLTPEICVALMTHHSKEMLCLSGLKMKLDLRGGFVPHCYLEKVTDVSCLQMVPGLSGKVTSDSWRVKATGCEIISADWAHLTERKWWPLSMCYFELEVFLSLVSVCFMQCHTVY